MVQVFFYFCPSIIGTIIENISSVKTLTKIAFLTLLLAATSCASHKKTVAPTPPSTYEWLSSKVDIDVEGNSMAVSELSGQLRMRRDSIVWLSVTAAMGVEVARIKVSADSAWVINRIEKTYLAEPLDSLAKRLGMPISLPWVQTMLLDNNEGVPPVENQTVLLKNFKFGKIEARVRYHKIKLDEQNDFPLKITDKMERIYLTKKK